MSKNFGLAVAAAADSEQKRNNSMKKMKRKTNLTSEICLGSNEKTQKFEVFSLPHIFQDTIIYAPNTQWNPGRLLFLVHIHSQKKTSIHISNMWKSNTFILATRSSSISILKSFFSSSVPIIYLNLSIIPYNVTGLRNANQLDE